MWGFVNKNDLADLNDQKYLQTSGEDRAHCVIHLRSRSKYLIVCPDYQIFADNKCMGADHGSVDPILMLKWLLRVCKTNWTLVRGADEENQGQQLSKLACERPLHCSEAGNERVGIDH